VSTEQFGDEEVAKPFAVLMVGPADLDGEQKMRFGV
jgi:hypothetical protein